MTVVFTYEEGSVLLRLLAAHLLTDFYLQRSHWVQSKMKKNLVSGYLWFHTLIAGATAWLALWSFSYWWVFVITFITHLLTDAWKIKASRSLQESSLEPRQKARKDLRLFLADQLIHILVIVLLWLQIIHGYSKFGNAAAAALPDYHLLLLFTGYLVVLQPTGFFIGYVTKRWLPELNMNDSLRDAGTWIGMLERTIVITLIFSNQYSAIGFLIAAKSILRVTDKPEKNSGTDVEPFSSRKHTEYVLIGTFLSFGCALLTGIFINYLMSL